MILRLELEVLLDNFSFSNKRIFLFFLLSERATPRPALPPPMIITSCLFIYETYNILKFLSFLLKLYTKILTFIGKWDNIRSFF